MKTSELKDAAEKTVVNIRDFLKPAASKTYKLANAGYKDAYNASDDLIDQIRDAYPSIAESVRETAAKLIGQGRNALITAGDSAEHAASGVSSFLGGFGAAVASRFRGLESSLLKVGFIYAIYRLFLSDERVRQLAGKAKARIEARPVESAVIAIGVGYVVGRFIRF